MSSNPGTGNYRYFCINLLYNLHHVLKLKIISSLSQFHNYYCISYKYSVRFPHLWITTLSCLKLLCHLVLFCSTMFLFICEVYTMWRNEQKNVSWQATERERESDTFHTFYLQLFSSLKWLQCDQMVRLFLNIWPFATMKISPIMLPNSPKCAQHFAK